MSHAFGASLHDHSHDAGFATAGKVPSCILTTFDYYTIKPDNCTNGSGVSGLELSHIVLFFPSSFLCSKLQHIIYFCFIPELSHNWDTIIWHLS